MAGEAEIDRMIIRLIGDGSSYEKMLRRSETVTGKTMKGIGQSLTRAGESMTQLGRKLAISITLPLVAMGVASTVAFASFDKAMVESTSIMAVTEDQIESMRSAALELSGSGRVLQGPAELARSYFFLASAGKNAEQSIALLPKVASFATAGAFDMALATDLLTDAQSALGLSTRNVAEDTRNLVMVSDALVGANTLANASVQQFATSLTSKAGAAMKAFNIPLNQGVALLAAYADQGIKAELAGNAMDRMLRLLAKSAIENADQFERMKIDVFDAQGEFETFANIIGDLEKAFEGMSTEQKIIELGLLGFEARVQSVILPLLGTSEAIEEYVERLDEMGGITDEVTKKQLEAFSNKLKIIGNQIKVIGIDIGAILVEDLEGMTGAVEDSTGAWGKLSNTLKEQIVTVAEILAGIPLLLIAIGALTKGLGLLFKLAAGGLIVFKALGFVVAATLLLIEGAVAGIGAFMSGLGPLAVAAILAAAEVTIRVAKLREFNDETERAIELQQELTERFADKTFGIFEELRGLGEGADARGFLTKEIEAAKLEVTAYTNHIKAAKQELEEVDGLMARVFNKRSIAEVNDNIDEFDELLGLANQRVQLLQSQLANLPAAVDLDELEEALEESIDDELQDRLESTLKSLQRQAITFGLEPELAAIVDFRFDPDVTLEQFLPLEEAARFISDLREIQNIQNELEADSLRSEQQAERIRRSVLTPIEKLQEEQLELEKLRGLLEPDIFNRAMGKLAADFEKEQLTGARGQALQRFAPTANIQAAAVGSAEAQARILAFRSTGPEVSAAETTADEVTTIREILERLEAGETGAEILEASGLR